MKLLYLAGALLAAAMPLSLTAQQTPDAATPLPPAQTVPTPSPAPPTNAADNVLRSPRSQYMVLPGDVIDLHYRYTPIFDQTVTVPPDSFLDLNVVGRIYVGGLTLSQVESIILDKANDRLNEPEITVTLKTAHTSYVVVAGEVNKPGKLDLQDGYTALRAIMLAGGFSQDARSGEVLVFRQINATTAEVHVLKLGRLDRNKDLNHDLALQSGDTIMVPHDRIFNVSRFIKLANIGFYLNPLQNLTY